MSNLASVKDRKPIFITLSDGIERKIQFTLNSMASLEDAYGDIDEIMGAMNKGKIKAIRAMLWAGLANNEEQLTELQVGALIDIRDMPDIMATLNDAMPKDMPAPAEETDKIEGAEVDAIDPNLAAQE